MDGLSEKLLSSNDPFIRFYVRKYLSGRTLKLEEECQLRETIGSSERVRALLSERTNDAMVSVHPYKKWFGAHWILLALAELYYPENDKRILPLANQVYGWLLSPGFLDNIYEIKGRIRGHSCIVGNSLYYLSRLGFTKDESNKLLELLLSMQWPDGGWNCDRKPGATCSSFNSTAIAVRGLVHYRNNRCNQEDCTKIDAAVSKGVKYLVDHELCKRITTGEIAHQDFLKFFYPEYYHYNVLYGLKVLVEADYGYDEKLDFALNHVRSHKTEMGWVADKKYYWKSKKDRAGKSLVNWGVVKESETNEFITVEALRVLDFFEKKEKNQS